MPDDGLLVANIDFDGIKGSLEIKQSPASTSVERDKSSPLGKHRSPTRESRIQPRGLHFSRRGSVSASREEERSLEL